MKQHSGYFTVALAGEGWESASRLAEACEAAGLTRMQAEVVLAMHSGLGLAETAERVGLTAEATRQCGRRALAKLRRAHQELVQAHRRWCSDLLLVMANRPETGGTEGGEVSPVRARLVTADDLAGGVHWVRTAF